MAQGAKTATEVYAQMSKEEVRNMKLPKREDNFIMIELGYDCKFIFPYKEGMAFLEAFKTAEKYDTEDFSNPVIAPLNKGLEIKVIPPDQYKEMKVMNLLKVNT